ncbi:MAG: hypothetical protein A2289_25920 [Deltaproteobacteria bacterium RIFOXYA12_FULL_58_15]|nr:MAG: hypothetical protein A2289_25920 [Deltaproteobacteria bacterium RIFOXYA12_FULL_58_15]
MIQTRSKENPMACIFRCLTVCVIITVGCSKIVANLDNLACSPEGDCAPGFVCNLDTQLCESESGHQSCTLGTLSDCAACGDNCLELPRVTTAECVTEGTVHECVIVGCEAGWTNDDGLVSTGCNAECVQTNGGVEICDGFDNDCEGTTDPSCPCNFRDKSNGVCVGTTTNLAGQCQQPTEYETQESACDSLDNDCDGLTDEGCACDYLDDADGVCATATNSGSNCEQPAAYEVTETTCDGIDNDCDGSTDTDCPCQYDGDPDGVCGTAKLDGSGNCVEPTTHEASETLCDDVDNDCDGIADSGCPCHFQDDPDGVCASATRDSAGQCQQPSGFEEIETTCGDGDNDCDGLTNEGCGCNFNDDTDGVCATGIPNGPNCIAPDNYEANETSCDRVDNDCDEAIDEGCACNYVGDADGVCNTATRDDSGVCQPPGVYEADEITCDNLDNDCDGVEDEGCPCNFGGDPDGICATAIIANTGVCQQPSGYQANETRCDNTDNDCDNAIDEGCPCNYNDDPDGLCATATRDVNGVCQAPATYESTESTCDTFDNDCDEGVDEGCPCNYGGDMEGVCQSGTKDGNGSCLAPDNYEANETTCDDADNDCDTFIDEGCPCNYNDDPHGVCADAVRDVNGVCQPPANYQSDEDACDSADNDCDEAVDEGCAVCAANQRYCDGDGVTLQLCDGTGSGPIAGQEITCGITCDSDVCLTASTVANATMAACTSSAIALTPRAGETLTFTENGISCSSDCNGNRLGTPQLIASTTEGNVDWVCVSSLALNATSTLHYDSTATRPLVVLVAGNATIDGSIDFNGTSASGFASPPGGPGGGAGGAGGEQSAATPGDDGFDYTGTPGTACTGKGGLRGGVFQAGGGGGGALRGSGGRGGDGSDSAGGAGGSSLTLTAVVGGCGGGGGGDGRNPESLYGGNNGGGAGGGAGGGVQISARGVLTLSGTVAANGGNGANEKGNHGAGGGGSGGMIVLEGYGVLLNGGILVDGGDGGDNIEATATALPGAGATGDVLDGTAAGANLTDGGPGGGGGGGAIGIRSHNGATCSGASPTAACLATTLQTYSP